MQPLARIETDEMCQILEEDPDVGGRLRADQFLVHVGFPGQALHVRVAADLDELLAALVVRVPVVLHDAENEEHPAM